MLPPDAELSRIAWPQASFSLVLVPLGSLEQHGPHLPLGTDTTIAVSVARRLCERAREEGRAWTVAPAVPYGASGEHEGFGGTVSIGTDALTRLIVELGRSASRWASRVVFVNGHGGNVDALRDAVTLLRSEARDSSWIACMPGPDVDAPDPHAGRHETALLLHLDPRAVRIDLAEPGETRPLAETLPILRERGVVGVSPNGVLGDPTGATAERGARILDSICARAWDALVADAVATDGRRIGSA